jgi:hypothetical protein
LTFDDLDLVIARNGRRYLAAVVTRGIRVVDVFGVRALDKDSYVMPVAELFRSKRLSSPDANDEIPPASIAVQRP